VTAGVRLALALAAAMPGFGCNDVPVVCTAIAVPGIQVDVRDSVTGLPATDGALGIARDGAYVDTLETLPTAGPLPSPTMLGAWERQGTYDVTISKANYLTWSAAGVRVSGDACHVTTVKLDANLQPSP
jgi:hypothetical protein